LRAKIMGKIPAGKVHLFDLKNCLLKYAYNPY
jgi:hypothetical protein